MMLLTHMLFWGSGITICMSGVRNALEVICVCTASALLAGLCYLLRREIKTRILFFVLHLALAVVGVFIIRLVNLSGWYGFILVVILLWSIMLRCAKVAAWLEEPTYVYAGTLGVILLIIGRYHAMNLAKIICASSIVLLYLCKQFYRNLIEIERYVDTRGFGTNVDSVHAKNLCKQIAALFFGSFSFLIGILGVTRIAGIGGRIETWVYRLWEMLTSNFKLDPSEVPFMIGGMEGNNSPGGMFEDLVGEQKPSPFVEFMSKVLLIGGEIIIAAAVIFGVIKLFVVIFRSFRRREIEREGNVFVEKINIETRGTKTRKKRINEIKGNGPAKQIRRIYKKRMIKIVREETDKFSHMAPEKQVQCLEEHNYDEPSRKEIRDVYEKARYGENVASNQDVEKMGTLI